MLGPCLPWARALEQRLACVRCLVPSSSEADKVTSSPPYLEDCTGVNTVGRITFNPGIVMTN